MPTMKLPDLPVTEAIPSVLAALAAGRNAVLVAPPGAGKTTLVPLALLDAAWRGDGRILMLEPRRLATRAAAARMAALLGQTPGDTVGFRTRLDAAVSAGNPHRGGHRGPADPPPAIRSGAGWRRCGHPGRGARALGRIAIWRSAFCLDLQRVLRPELRLLAMSATADGARLAALMDADVIESAGRMFPVAIRHAARDIPGPRELPDAMAACRACCAGGARRRYPGFPAGYGGDPPDPGGDWRGAVRWCCRCTVTCRRRSRIARCGRQRAGAWCWQPRSPRRR